MSGIAGEPPEGPGPRDPEDRTAGAGDPAGQTGGAEPTRAEDQQASGKLEQTTGERQTLWRRLRKPAAWTGGVVTAVVIAAVTASVTGAIRDLFGSQPSVQITASWPEGPCTAQYLDMTAQRAASLPSLSGVDIGDGYDLEITNQTPSSEAIIITGMSVTVLSHGPLPKSGIVVQSDTCTGGGGGGITLRTFDVNLDASPPQVLAAPPPAAQAEGGAGGTAGSGSAPKPVNFPFDISQTDPEVFQLFFGDVPGEFTFTVQIDWVAAGKAGVTTLNNNGQGYRLIGTDDELPVYVYGSSPRDLQRVNG